MSFRDSIPKELVTHTIAMCGAVGERWLDSLPSLVRELEERWSINVGKPFPAIEFNYVAGAVDKNDKPVVILMKSSMGFGVDYMMGTHKWHGAAPNDEQLEMALLQLPATFGDY